MKSGSDCWLLSRTVEFVERDGWHRVGDRDEVVVEFVRGDPDLPLTRPDRCLRNPPGEL
jgi:hypothetical protein